MYMFMFVHIRPRVASRTGVDNEVFFCFVDVIVDLLVDLLIDLLEDAWKFLRGRQILLPPPSFLNPSKFHLNPS